MALGFSGSNGGITARYQRVARNQLFRDAQTRFSWQPLEVSYFANNVCNLKCSHCYVGYKQAGGSLSEQEWGDVFEQCVALGALTFGNVGKEPTLCWEKTVVLLKWLADRRRSLTRLRFGIVTNATRLDERKASELCAVAPDYLDISLDGVGETHDAIRGRGTYEQTTRNIASLPKSLKERVFISFTANEFNVASLPALVREAARLGVKNMLVSPYVSPQSKARSGADLLLATDNRLVRMCIDLIEGRLVDFRELDGFQIYVKNDFTARLSLMESLVRAGVVDFENLWEDDYGILFTPYSFTSNRVYFSYLPFDSTFRKAIRFSHDGFIGNCYDMFFRDYTKRTAGNVRELRLGELYRRLEADFGNAIALPRKAPDLPKSESDMGVRSTRRVPA